MYHVCDESNAHQSKQKQALLATFAGRLDAVFVDQKLPGENGYWQ